MVFDKIQHLVWHVQRGGDALFPGSICDTLWRKHSILHTFTHVGSWHKLQLNNYFFFCIDSFSDSAVISLPGKDSCLIRIMSRKRWGVMAALFESRLSVKIEDRNVCKSLLSTDVSVSTGCPAEGSRWVLTTPGLGSGTWWLYVYHCWVSRLTSRYRPLNAFSTWSIVKAHTAELPEAPLYLYKTEKKHLSITGWWFIWGETSET